MFFPNGASGGGGGQQIPPNGVPGPSGPFSPRMPYHSSMSPTGLMMGPGGPYAPSPNRFPPSSNGTVPYSTAGPAMIKSELLNNGPRYGYSGGPMRMPPSSSRPSGPGPSTTMPLSHFANAGNRAPHSGSHQQIHIFTTALANEAAAAVESGKCRSIIDHHKDHVTREKKEQGILSGVSYATSVTPPAFSQAKAAAIQQNQASMSTGVPFGLDKVKTEPQTSNSNTMTPSSCPLPSRSIASVVPMTNNGQQQGVKRPRTSSVDVPSNEHAAFAKAPASVPPLSSNNPSTPLERAASVSGTTTGPATPSISTGTGTQMTSTSVSSGSLTTTSVSAVSPYFLAAPTTDKSSLPLVSPDTSLPTPFASSASPRAGPVGDDPLSQMERLANNSLPLEPPLKQQRLMEPRSGGGMGGKEKKISQQIILDEEALTPTERVNRQKGLQMVSMLREQFQLDSDSVQPPQGPGMGPGMDMNHPRFAHHHQHPYQQCPPHQMSMMMSEGYMYAGNAPGQPCPPPHMMGPRGPMPPHVMMTQSGNFYDPHKQAWEEMVAKHENEKIHQHFQADPSMSPGVPNMGYAPMRGSAPPQSEMVRVPSSQPMGRQPTMGMYGNKPTVMVAPHNIQSVPGGMPRHGPMPRGGAQRMPHPRMFPPNESYMITQEEMMMQQQEQQWIQRGGPSGGPQGMVMTVRGSGQASMQVYGNPGPPPNEIMMMSDQGHYGPPQASRPNAMHSGFPSDPQMSCQSSFMSCPPDYGPGPGGPGMDPNVMMMTRTSGDFNQPPRVSNVAMPNGPPNAKMHMMQGPPGGFEVDFQGGVVNQGQQHSGQPTVNNTYVNATMSIQQLNIQNVGPPIHPGGPGPGIATSVHSGAGGRVGAQSGGHPHPSNFPHGMDPTGSAGNDFNLAFYQQGLAEPITNLDQKVPSQKLQYFPTGSSAPSSSSLSSGRPQPPPTDVPPSSGTLMGAGPSPRPDSYGNGSLMGMTDPGFGFDSLDGFPSLSQQDTSRMLRSNPNDFSPSPSGNKGGPSL